MSIATSLAVFGLLQVTARHFIGRAAEAAAIEHAGNLTVDAAESALRPVLVDEVLAGDSAALRALALAARELIAGPDIEHVKIWSADGTVIWSDDAGLIGRHFDLPDVQAALLGSERMIAGVSDLGSPDDVAGMAGDDERLVEVHYGTHTDGGLPIVVETYTPYDIAERNAASVRARLMPLISILLVVLAAGQAALVYAVSRRLARSERRRSRLLQLAVDASDAERRRIAAEVHDGVVQELTGISFALTAAAHDESGAHADRAELRSLAGDARSAVTSLRGLLARIYPVEVPAGGWVAGLDDLVETLEDQGAVVDVRVDHCPLSDLEELLLLRVARETLRNVAKHAGASTVTVELAATRHHLTLIVSDDGDGFDPSTQPEGHIGLRLLKDLARDDGGRLDIESSPGVGTTVRFELIGAS